MEILKFNKRIMKKYIHSKTLWVALGTIVTSVGMLVTGDATLTEWVIGALGVAFGYLRTVTSTGVEA